MFIDVIPNRSSPPTILLRESFRKDGKVKKRTLANLSKVPPEWGEVIRVGLKGEKAWSPDQAFEIASKSHGHVAAVLGTLRRLGLEELIASTHSRTRDLVCAMIVSRILEPESMPVTAQELSAMGAINTLGETLDLNQVDEEELTEAMDWLAARQWEIENRLAARHIENGSLTMWHLIPVWMEDWGSESQRVGDSGDDMKGEPQLAIGLLSDRTGRPIAAEVFDEAGAPGALSSVFERVRERLGFERAVVIGDRELLTEARIRESLEPAGLDWIVTSEPSVIRELIVRKVFQPSSCDESDPMEMTCPKLYPGERLIVCRDSFVAREQRLIRADFLEATELGINEVKAATQRNRDRLEGSQEISRRMARELSRYGMGEYFEVKIGENGVVSRRLQERIDAEEALDGCFLLRTSLAPEKMNTEEIVSCFRIFSGVNRAFCPLDSIDDEIRPAPFRPARSERSQFFLGMLAWYVEHEMRKRLAPLLLDEEDGSPGESDLPEARSNPKTRMWAAAKRKEQKLPAMNYRELLQYLAAMAKFEIQLKTDPGKPFEMYSRPTELQAAAFDLLEVQLVQ